MRKIIVSEFFSVDGMMSDPGDTMKWVGTEDFGNGVILLRYRSQS